MYVFVDFCLRVDVRVPTNLWSPRASDSSSSSACDSGCANELDRLCGMPPWQARKSSLCFLDHGSIAPITMVQGQRRFWNAHYCVWVRAYVNMRVYVRTCICTFVNMCVHPWICVGFMSLEDFALTFDAWKRGKTSFVSHSFFKAFSALMAPLTQEAVQKWVDDFMKATSGGGDPKCPTDWKRIEELMSKRCTVRNSHRYSDRTHTHRQECSYGHTFTAKGRWRR